MISIFPMTIADKPYQFRIVEIYSDKNAYESHLKTEHFQHYKTSTLNMVKSLKLVEMNSVDKNEMPQIFQKLK